MLLSRVGAQPAVKPALRSQGACLGAWSPMSTWKTSQLWVWGEAAPSEAPTASEFHDKPGLREE